MLTGLGYALQWMPHGGPHQPMGPYGGSGGGAMAWGGSAATGLGPFWTALGILVLLGIVVTGMYLLLARAGPSSPDSDAIDILRRRYASGDIDEEEFERRLVRLSHETTV